MTRKQGMPILSPKGLDPIPWNIIAPHAAQAFRNHSQTLQRLKERGGLSAAEAGRKLDGRAM